MKIRAAKNEKTNQPGFSLDITIDNVRYRRWFPTREKLNRFIRHKEDERDARRDGLPNRSRQRITLLQLIEKFLADDLATSKTHNYQLALKRSATAFAASVGDADLPITKITQQHLRDFVITIKGQKDHGDGTTANYYRQVQTILRAARDLFPAELANYQPPAIKLGRLGINQKQFREHVLSPTELRAIYEALQTEQRYHRETRAAANFRRAHAADFFALLFLTLKRQNELLSLTWQDVSFEMKTIGFKLTKTKDYQVLPMSPLVCSILERRKASGYDQPFPAHNCEKRYAAFRRASRAANVPYGEKTPNGYVPHDLRHTAGSYLVHAGIDPVTVGVLLGHQLGDGSTPVYLHASPTTLKRAMLKASELWQEYCQETDGAKSDKRPVSAAF